ncbi:MAG: SMC-Scp complex subunit ScpB [Bauldia sp.]|nr:SMC-Scp complex subunit ScpB [Bauldia sp.]
MAEAGVVRLFPASAPREDSAVAAEIRIVEALLFAAAEPVSAGELAARLPAGADLDGAIRELERTYAARGVNLVRIAGKYAFRTAGDLSYLMSREKIEQRRLSRAALETLAVVAYHQPVTRAEIEEIRGVSLGTGTLDVLLETGWVRIRGRRRTPGRPLTYGTSEAFLEHFGLDTLGDLPGVEELTAAGLLAAGQALPAIAPEPQPEDPYDPDEDVEGEEAEIGGAVDASAEDDPRD